jgi:hypothetical protein
MRAAREQPRIFVAKVLGVLCLMGCSLAAGILLGGGGGDDNDAVVRAQQSRVRAAERALGDQADELRRARGQLTRERAAHAHTRARLRACARRNVRLRRDLRRARRALARARR